MNEREEEKEEESIEEKKIEEGIEERAEEAKETKEAKEEKKKPGAEKKVEAKEDIVEERIYTVPLSRAWIAPRKGRSPKATRILKNFIERHMKIDEDSIVIVNEVNEKIWSRGIEKPPRKIRVRAVKDTEGMVTVHLAEGD